MSTMKEMEMSKNLTARADQAMETAPVVECMKTLMMVFNVIFWVTGVVILAIGIWTHEDLYVYLKISTIYQPGAPYVLIAIGAIIVLVGALSCLCTIKGHPLPIYVLSGFLVAVFLVEFSCGIAVLVEKEKLNEGFSAGLTKAMDKYGDNNDLLDWVQKKMVCCGINNYTDWYADRNVSSSWEAGQYFSTVPESCCKSNDPAKKCRFEGPFPEFEADIFTQGCHKLLVDFIGGSLGPIGGVSLGIGFFTGLGAILAFFLGKSIDKATYEQVA